MLPLPSQCADVGKVNILLNTLLGSVRCFNCKRLSHLPALFWNTSTCIVELVPFQLCESSIYGHFNNDAPPNSNLHLESYSL